MRHAAPQGLLRVRRFLAHITRAHHAYLQPHSSRIHSLPCTPQKDPEYGRLVREAAAAGVLLLPVVCALDAAAGAVRFRGPLPLRLDHKFAG